MDTLNVLIVPGLSSPHHESHKSSYFAIQQEAVNRGYCSKVVHHPGQIDEKGNQDGVLCLDSSVENLTRYIIELEEKQQKYRLIGFSYGCYVVSSTLGRLPELKGIERAILWGVVPLWSSWKGFIKGEGVENMGKGTNIIQTSGEYFRQLEPIEYWLPRIPYMITVALGEEDEYVTASYIDYLRSINVGNGKKNCNFTIVQGCVHTVRNDENCKNWQGYLSTILG